MTVDCRMLFFYSDFYEIYESLVPILISVLFIN